MMTMGQRCAFTTTRLLLLLTAVFVTYVIYVSTTCHSHTPTLVMAIKQRTHLVYNNSNNNNNHNNNNNDHENNYSSNNNNNKNHSNNNDDDNENDHNNDNDDNENDHNNNYDTHSNNNDDDDDSDSHKDKLTTPYGADNDVIFIGGVPRSGTTLMRVMLDAHPHVRCGPETRVIPRILGLRASLLGSSPERRRLEAAGVTTHVLDSAVKAFVAQVMAGHGEAAPRLCNKDPFTLKAALFLSRQFPRAKFLLMVRDGRAVVHSIISRRVTIRGFDLGSYRTCLQKWNAAMETMHVQCLMVGPARCLHVYYEQLVLHPRRWMEKILRFLDLPWNDSVLHHQDFIGHPISLSSKERSTDQVVRPVNREALTRWVGHLPDNVTHHLHTLAPMLATLGYDPRASPPDYGQSDPPVPPQLPARPAPRPPLEVEGGGAAGRTRRASSRLPGEEIWRGNQGR
ncbi:protein-tyrosine sulfotransferase 1-like [Babylonia areolata]|uniref:protein-tyrosine sulfotransferase 1-like n=1 Tax=Babylonia areolata TaxID=304850 RepID=UPI003FD62CBD